MAPTWRLAPSLVQLLKEVNAHWPLRNKTSDGTLGNAFHAARLSDHNPDGRHVVCAVDIDEDLGGSKATAYPFFNTGQPAKVAFVDVVLNLAKAGKLPQLHYLIYERKIYQAKNKFLPVAYVGPNAHEHHVHVSVNHQPVWADRTTAWGLFATPSSAPLPVVAAPPAATVIVPPKAVASPVVGPRVTLSVAEVNRARGGTAMSPGVLVVQQWLNVTGAKLTADGYWGPKTQAALDSFRRSVGYTGADAEGSVGIIGLTKLRPRSNTTSIIEGK